MAVTRRVTDGNEWKRKGKKKKKGFGFHQRHHCAVMWGGKGGGGEKKREEERGKGGDDLSLSLAATCRFNQTQGGPSRGERKKGKKRKKKKEEKEKVFVVFLELCWGLRTRPAKGEKERGGGKKRGIFHLPPSYPSH